jgi:hypothetical protein
MLQRTFETVEFLAGETHGLELASAFGGGTAWRLDMRFRFEGHTFIAFINESN